MSIEYNGFADLAGRTIGTITVVSLARRTPNLAWSFRCNQCGSSSVALHTALVSGAFICPNRSCGRIDEKPASSNGFTSTGQTGIRSADSESARQYYRNEQRTVQQRQTQQEPSAEALLNADPDSIRRYLDSIKEK